MAQWLDRLRQKAGRSVAALGVALSILDPGPPAAAHAAPPAAPVAGDAAQNGPPPVAPEMRPVTVQEIGEALAAEAVALTQQGIGYKWGAKDPASGGLDCSGLTQWAHVEVMKQYGISAETARAMVPQGTMNDAYGSGKGQFQRGTVVQDGAMPPEAGPPFDAMIPGDLIFLRMGEGSYHVLMYVGRNDNAEPLVAHSYARAGVGPVVEPWPQERFGPYVIGVVGFQGQIAQAINTARGFTAAEQEAALERVPPAIPRARTPVVDLPPPELPLWVPSSSAPAAPETVQKSAREYAHDRAIQKVVSDVVDKTFAPRRN